MPQIGGMSEGDRSRKQTLVDYGFRLPSAIDNRPLRFDEFLEKVSQLVFVSATPGAFELRHSTVVAEQLIRPTFVVDPDVELRPTQNQIDDLLSEIRRREQADERVLVTTLTKKMAEDLTDYLLEAGVRARYLHSEIDTLERISIIREKTASATTTCSSASTCFREGLDLPEVSLVAILDADKEGFLRGKTALVQTIGRAARKHVNGLVILYADKVTDAIPGEVEETDRRRAKQVAYNEEHGITPETIVKGVSDIAEFLSLQAPTVPGRRRRGKRDVEGMSRSLAGNFEPQLRPRRDLLLELDDELLSPRATSLRRSASAPSPARNGRCLEREKLGDVRDTLDDRLRRDAMLGVVSELQFCRRRFGLSMRPLHRVGHPVGVEDHLGVDVAGRPADRLDQRRFAAQEPLLVRVEDGHERHFGQIEPFAQQVDADEHVERSLGAARAAPRRARWRRARSAATAAQAGLVEVVASDPRPGAS